MHNATQRLLHPEGDLKKTFLIYLTRPARRAATAYRTVCIASREGKQRGIRSSSADGWRRFQFKSLDDNVTRFEPSVNAPPPPQPPLTSIPAPANSKSGKRRKFASKCVTLKPEPKYIAKLQEEVSPALLLVVSSFTPTPLTPPLRNLLPS